MTTFENLGLAPELVRAVSELGFETPTPIQLQSIPLLLESPTDLVALAQTGTGKTAAFGLPLLQRIDTRKRHIQALILSPTRELCMQITRDLEAFGKHLPGFGVVAVYGGASIQGQLKQIQDGVQVVVATPGRLVDIMQKRKTILENVQIAVLDEADEMLNMGFRDDLDTILSYTPGTKNTWLFSASMPNEVLNISRNFMRNPKEVSSGEKNVTNKNIEHVYYVVHARDKYMALKRIADFHPDIFAIVFCRTKIETQQIADMLVKDGYNADSLHGDLSQAQRDVVMKRYRNRSLQLLVATDVAARGIDVDDVTHVIHYSLPDEPESYLHRSGRTARAGKKGVSMVLINMKEIGRIKMIERLVKTTFTRVQLPLGNEVCENQLLSLVKKVHNVDVNRSDIEPFMPAIYEELSELSREEIITRFISVEFNRFLDYYRNSPDLNAYGNNEEFSHGGGIKMFLTLGSLDGLNKQTIKEFVAKTAGIDEAQIPWVDVKNSYSFVEVNAASVEKIQAAFKENITYNGRRAQIELRAQSGRDRDGGGRERRGSGRNDRGGDNRGGGGYRGRNDRPQGGGGDRNRRGGDSRPYSGARGPETRSSNGGARNQWSKPKNDRSRDMSGPSTTNNFAQAPKNKKESLDLSAELKSIFEMDKKELRKLEKNRKGN
ncbi:MAG: DEAD/DEAH box helicase [Bacteroidetes bacterium]|nr:DEAD/DEAH box helicase [Bacteroidota bacterium]